MNICHEIDEECYEDAGQAPRGKDEGKQGVIEQLKAENQMLLSGEGNNLTASVLRRIVVREVV